MTLTEIVSQLKWCEYECCAGRLEDNVAFVELEKMAAEEEEYRVIQEYLDSQLFVSMPGRKRGVVGKKADADTLPF